MRVKYIDGKRTFTLTDKNLPSGKSSNYADVEKWKRFQSQNIFNTTPVDGTELKIGDFIMTSQRPYTYYSKVVKITPHRVFTRTLYSRVIYEYERYFRHLDEDVVMYRVNKFEDSTDHTQDEKINMTNKKQIFHKVFDKNKMYDAYEIYLD